MVLQEQKTQEQGEWCTKGCPSVLQELQSSEHGLSVEEATERLSRFGKNKLREQKPDTILKIFLRQFASPLLYVLIAAGIVALALGEIVDGAIIIAVLLFNGVVGSFQEGRAQNALFALKKFSQTYALVLRDNQHMVIESAMLVPGDIVVLKEGDKVPADGRILESNGLMVNEAALTGESIPVTKTEGVIEKEDVVISDQTNMAWNGTHVVKGTAKIVVTATGLYTEIGKLAEKIQSIHTEIPLKTNIKRLARVIIIATLVAVVILFFVGIATGNTPREMLLIAVSLTVSVVPEGLPIVLTLILAKGVHRMSKRNVLVKRLQAVEALGQAKVIAVDKTGTLTKNEIVSQKIFIDNTMFDVTGVGYDNDGTVLLAGKDAAHDTRVQFMGKYLTLVANAEILKGRGGDGESASDKTVVAGDPTEAALLVLGEKIGFSKKELLETYSRTSEIPFDYRNKFYASVFTSSQETVLIDTGAPEVVLKHCNEVWKPHGKDPMTEETMAHILDTVERMSRQGLRVIALAIQEDADEHAHVDTMQGLSFVGLIGMKDALRKEVSAAMAKAHGAGMRVVMITGDHKTTAMAIASEAGIYRPKDKVLTGGEISSMSVQQLAQAVADTTVFARVTPEHKLLIIEAYKSRGEIIAMTGDGVNDVPPLVAANLGVAMGIMGTEVTKEAADLILLDDNFGNIPHAVAEGRHIYEAIKKVIMYLFSTNLGEFMVVVLAVFLVLPLPLTAAQIIWLNLVTDSFLVIALGLEPMNRNLLKRSFKKATSWILDRAMIIRMLLMASVMTAGSLAVFVLYLPKGLLLAMTMTLTTLAAYQWYNVWNVRSKTQSVFTMNPLRNKTLILMTIVAVAVQVFAVYTPFMQDILTLTNLGIVDWVIVFAIGASIIVAEEFRKFIIRASKRKSSPKGAL